MTLLDAVRIVRRFWLTITACILLAVAVAAAYAAVQPRTYTAGAQAFVSVGNATQSPRPPWAATWPAPRRSPTPPSERMRDLIAELSQDYLVIIDAPPALPVTDAMIMAQRVDGIIVITYLAKTRKEHLQKVLQAAENVNVRIFGIVLNGIPQGRSAKVYGYETYGYGAEGRRGRQQQQKKNKNKNKAKGRRSGPSRATTRPATEQQPADREPAVARASDGAPTGPAWSG